MNLYRLLIEIGQEHWQVETVRANSESKAISKVKGKVIKIICVSI
jgi:hypothetical protein